MDEILKNNSKHSETINNMKKYLKVIESVDETIEKKLIKNEIELKKYKLMIDENINALKKIANNLI